MNYIVFGGTFDPIHNGHIRIANAASKKYNAKVIFVPAKSPRWKKPTESSENRLEMLKIALKAVDFQYEICDFELKSNKTINYSVETLRYLKKIHKNDNLYFLIGYDQVNKFDKWEKPDEISELSTILYTNRPGFRLNKRNVKRYKMVDLGFDESGNVSSSDIRELKSLDINKDVLHYIEANRLYFVNKLSTFVLEKRLNHSISVANLAYKIAETNKLKDSEKYYIAGLLHDIGKTYNKEDQKLLDLMKANYKKYLDIPNFAYHQFVGELLVKKEFEIKDREILDAIKFHCTGKANMSSLGMVIYAADKIDPLRDFDSTWLMNSCFKNWKQGFLDTLEDNRKYLLENKKDITNKLTDECFKMYLK